MFYINIHQRGQLLCFAFCYVNRPFRENNLTKITQLDFPLAFFFSSFLLPHYLSLPSFLLFFLCSFLSICIGKKKSLIIRKCKQSLLFFLQFIFHYIYISHLTCSFMPISPPSQGSIPILAPSLILTFIFSSIEQSFPCIPVFDHASFL